MKKSLSTAGNVSARNLTAELSRLPSCRYATAVLICLAESAGEHAMDNEHYEELSPMLGLPGYDDIRKWRDLIDATQRGSSFELCGIKATPDGKMLGIFRRKNPDANRNER